MNNPHNPSGVLYSQYEVANLAVDAKIRESCFIIDEAFIDYTPAASVLAVATGLPNLIVICSLTKFYAQDFVSDAIWNPDLASKLETTARWKRPPKKT